MRSNGMSGTDPGRAAPAWQAQAQAGLQALRQGDSAAAAEQLAAAHQAKPDHPGIAIGLAAARNQQGRPDAALAALDAAGPAGQNLADWHHQRGVALNRKGDLGGSAAAFRQAVACDPASLNERHKLAQALRDQAKLGEAEAQYRAALDAAATRGEPSDQVARLWHNLGMVLRDQSRMPEAIGCFRTAIAHQPDLEGAHTYLLLCLHYDPDQDQASLFEAHRAWRDQFWAGVETVAPALPAHPPEKAPLTVGVLGGDLRRHPELWLTLRAFAHLDPAVVRLYVYDYSTRHDDFTDLLRAQAALWRDVGALEDGDLVAQMRADGLDILINKAGHAEGRLGVCAHRVAPVQVQWGGFNTSALANMDWFLADWREVPPGEERWFTESVYRLPDDYVCYAPPDAAPPVAPLPAHETGIVTFGCFNHPAKLNERIAGLWAQLLAAVPHSRLFLKGKAFTDPEVAEPLQRRLAAAGLPAERLLVEGHAPHHELLAAYNHVDIALDPWPYSGGLTTIEALWMGVPVVTRPGPSFVGRHAATHLANAGLSDWITPDGESYVAKAAAWASDLPALASLRAGLRARVAASPLVDGPRFARNLETALATMWREKAAAPGGPTP